MKSNQALGKLLQENITRLTEAARAVCTDPAQENEVIYRAVYKAKQKYKKLINKDRVVDLCITYMRKPNKASRIFRSAEEAIDRALSARVFPLRPICSVAAVLLAIAILIPLVMPTQVYAVDAEGFVMEGTVALENRVGGDVQLKNLHAPTDLGALGPEELPDNRIEQTKTTQQITFANHDTVTTSLGVTLYVETYVNTETKESECIVYEAREDGWHEVGRFDTAFFVTTVLCGLYFEDGKEVVGYRVAYEASGINVLTDDAGNAYIMTVYRNGLQMHRYTANGKVEELDRIYLHDGKQQSDKYGTSNSWTCTIPFQSFMDKDRQSIETFMVVRNEIAPCTVTEDNSYSFIHFDMKTGRFDENVLVGEDLNEDLEGSIPAKITYDGDGGFYMITNVWVDDDTPEEDEIVKHDIVLALVHVKDGKVVSKSPIGRGNLHTTNMSPVLLAMDGTDIELVYKTKAGNYYMRFDKDGNQLEKKRIYAPSADPIEYLYFFRYEGEIYYLCYVDMTYLVLARVNQEDGRPVIVGEFLYPAKLVDIYWFTYEHTTPHVFNGNILNLLSPSFLTRNGEFPKTYFLQIVLGESAE